MIEVNYFLLYNELKKAVKIAKEEKSRPVLQLIKLYTKNDFLYIECTNSYVIWQSRIPILKKDADIKILFDSKTFKRLPNPKTYNKNVPIKIVLMEETIVFEIPNVKITIRHIEFSEYPKLSHIWKTENVNYSIAVSKKQLDFLTQGMDIVLFHFTPNNKRPAYITGHSDMNNVKHLILPVSLGEPEHYKINKDENKEE